MKLLAKEIKPGKEDWACPAIIVDDDGSILVIGKKATADVSRVRCEVYEDEALVRIPAEVFARAKEESNAG